MTTPCVEWAGYRDRNGYGKEGRRVGRNQRYAHRAAWEDTNGPIPAGMHVLHRCDNPPCVNLDHLWLGTHADNMADKAAKGRAARLCGEFGANAKLTAEQVTAIRTKRAAGALLRELADEFSVHLATISRIARKETWTTDDNDR